MKIVSSIIALAIALAWTSRCEAQIDTTSTASDSTGSALARMLRVGVAGAVYFHESTDRVFTAPEALARRRDDRRLVERWSLRDDYVADAPTYHGAGWVNVHLAAEPLHGVTGTAELLGENLGTSYGAFNARNLALIPIFRFDIDTAIAIGRIDAGPLHLDPFRIRTWIGVGHFSDMRLGEGLTIYNIDGEGSLYGIAVGPVSLRYTRIGDLAFGIGLGVDDVYDWRAGIDGVPLTDRLRLGAHLGSSLMTSTPWNLGYRAGSPRALLLDSVGLYDDSWTADLSIALDSLRLYAEGARRSAATDLYGEARSAFVAGFEGRWESGPLAIAGRTEYRHYGGLFNQGYRNTNVYYRDTTAGAYGNNIGSHIYPLPFFERPFSQWAVTTEYQNLRYVNVATLNATATLRLVKDFDIRLMVDANDVMAEGEDPFLYLFYNAGIGWEPRPGLSLRASITNKEINLDKHYMTFYMMRRPTVEYALRFRF